MQEAIAALRSRAELARRIASEIKEPGAAAGLREIADGLDAEADKLEAQTIVEIRSRQE